jgi:hypothetical protein
VCWGFGVLTAVHTQLGLHVQTIEEVSKGTSGSKQEQAVKLISPEKIADVKPEDEVGVLTKVGAYAGMAAAGLGAATLMGGIAVDFADIALVAGLYGVATGEVPDILDDRTKLLTGFMINLITVYIFDKQYCSSLMINTCSDSVAVVQLLGPPGTRRYEPRVQQAQCYQHW